MREVKVNVKAIAQYKGHSVKENGNLNLSLKLMYDELPNTIKMTQMLNNDVALVVKQGDQKARKIGSFRISGVNIDGDGESVIKLTSLVDFVEMDGINSLVTKDPFKVSMSAVVELEIDEGDEDE